MGSEANLTGGETHDGVSQPAHPIPQDMPPGPETPEDVDISAIEAAHGGKDTGQDPGDGTATANSAGGIAEDRNSAEETGTMGDNSAARDTVLGLNEAAGPADEQDRQQPDERGLTTDISPSD
jgi:hypothetical protein